MASVGNREEDQSWIVGNIIVDPFYETIIPGSIGILVTSQQRGLWNPWKCSLIFSHPFNCRWLFCIVLSIEFNHHVSFARYLMVSITMNTFCLDWNPCNNWNHRKRSSVFGIWQSPISSKKRFCRSVSPVCHLKAIAGFQWCNSLCKLTIPASVEMITEITEIESHLNLAVFFESVMTLMKVGHFSNWNSHF